MTEPLPSPPPPAEPQIGDSFDALLSQKPLLIASAVLFGALGWFYTSTSQPRYEAHTTIILPGSRGPSAAASLAASLGIGGAGGGGDTTLPMFRRILESDTATTAVARRLGLPKGVVVMMRKIEENGPTSTIDISAQSTDKAAAKNVVTEYIAELRNQNTRLSLPGKSKKAALLALTLATDSAALAQAEERLERFVGSAVTSPGLVGTVADTAPGDKNGSAGVSPAFRYRDQLTTLTLQLQKLDNQLSVIDSKSAEASRLRPDDYPPVAIWNGRMRELDAALVAARATYSPDSPEVRDVQRSHDQVEKLMQKDVAKYLTAVERRVTGDVSKLDSDRASVVRQIASIRQLADAAPKEALRYQRLVRDVTTLNSLVSQLRIQYEQAKLESADDPNRWEVLDAPTVGDGPVNRKFSRNVSAAVLVGFFVAVPVAMWRGKRRAGR